MSCIPADKEITGDATGVIIYSLKNCCYARYRYTVEWENKYGMYITHYLNSARDLYSGDVPGKAVMFSYGKYSWRLSRTSNVPYACDRRVIPFRAGSAGATITDRPEGVKCYPQGMPWFHTSKWINFHNTCFVLLNLWKKGWQYYNYPIWVYSTLYGWAPYNFSGELFPGTMGWALAGWVILEPMDLVFWGRKVGNSAIYKVRSFPLDYVQEVYELLPEGPRKIYPPKEVRGLKYNNGEISFYSNYSGRARLVVDGVEKAVNVISGMNRIPYSLGAGKHTVCVGDGKMTCITVNIPNVIKQVEYKSGLLTFYSNYVGKAVLTVDGVKKTVYVSMGKNTVKLPLTGGSHVVCVDPL